MGTKPHILVADDDSETLSYLETILKSKDFAVDAAREGSEARDKLARNLYDILITDVHMPNLNGFELVAYIKEKELKIPVIMISATATEITFDKATSIGAITLLEKPIDVAMLSISINRALTEKDALFKRNRKVLIIDDNDEFRDAVSHFLQMAGYDVLSARDGKEGLKIAQESAPRIDIAFVDEDMPDILGHEVIRKLKEVSPETLPILISGEATRGIVKEAYEEGAFSFIRKPVNFSNLLQCIISYEREEDERRKKVEWQKEFARKPVYKRIYYWTMGYVTASPSSSKNMVVRTILVSLLAIIMGVVLFIVVQKIQKHYDESQAQIEKVTELLKETNEYNRTREEREGKEGFYKKIKER